MSQDAILLSPSEGSDAMFTLEDVALRLGVPEASVREWLSSFRWERRFDGSGHLLLGERDLEFLRLIKSLKDVDRSCESIARLIDRPEQEDLAAEPAPPPDGQVQIETLKAELRELHARPRVPFWKFWARA